MFLFYSIKFYCGRAGKQVPKCRVLFCFKPLRRNVLPAFIVSVWMLGFFVCMFLLTSRLANWKGILPRTGPWQKKIAVQKQAVRQLLLTPVGFSVMGSRPEGALAMGPEPPGPADPAAGRGGASGACGGPAGRVCARRLCLYRWLNLASDSSALLTRVCAAHRLQPCTCPPAASPRSRAAPRPPLPPRARIFFL